MSESLPVSAGDDILASAYNNLRKDVLDNGVGHYHTGAEDGGRQIPESSLAFDVATQAELDATMNTTTGHDHDGTNSKALASGLYGARAIPTSSQTIPGQTYTKVLYGTETFDIQNEFTDSRYTAITEGYYQINASIYWVPDASSNRVDLYIRVNNYEKLVSEYYPTYDGIPFTVNLSDIYYLATNDYVEIWVYTNGSGGASTIGSNSAYPMAFSIIKIKSVA